MKIAATKMAMSAAGTAIIVGLNGALQKRFVLPDKSSLVPGNVHRAKDIQVGIGGKGQDVAVSFRCLEYNGDFKLVQFIGVGSAGDTVYKMLQDELGNDAMTLTIRPKTPLRTCTSIVASDETTELVEPSGFIDEEEMDSLLEKLDAMKHNVTALCIMGSMPPGCPDDTYGTIYNKVVGDETLCLADTVAGLESFFQSISTVKQKTKSRPITMLKVNAAELCKLAGVSKSKSETGGILQDELLDALSSIIYKKFHPLALDAIAITDGKHSAYLATIDNAVADDDNNNNKSFDLYTLPIPILPSDTTTLYPIGAGDSVSAGTLAAWHYLKVSKEGSTKANNYDDSLLLLLPNSITNALDNALSSAKKSNFGKTSKACTMLVAFSFGLCCGSASCLQEQNSVLDIKHAIDLFATIGSPSYVLTQKQ